MRQLKITQKITTRESDVLEKYLSDISRIDTLTADEEVVLAKLIRQGDKAALDKMVRSNLRFVVSVAKQYQNNGLTLNDLINEGNVGLLKAANRFDETKGFKFITYAVWWIRQSILQAIIENSRMIRLPYNKYHLNNKINEEYQDFIQKNEREPSLEELAELLHVSEEDIAFLGEIGSRTVSLDAPMGDEESSGVLMDLLKDSASSSPDMNLLSESMQKELKYAMRSLNAREREILTKLYGLEKSEPMTIEEVAREFGLSYEFVRQIREQAFRRLRRNFSKNNVFPLES
ncbi:MAG: RNA polymerase sigma factor RpoD/SigA [Saprospiraceae bacterium]|jgi:RNA polymerase primary sigma factor|nr:RNA polymerase sigma factor RpoD/SigA [Saprospiraceae bacterium]MBK7794752.1 RNA polymerase sigma factor RpoD/SigA [Saprospiraceae bacterium]MBL0261435.1 RNA polymerase sigma factor RpoD/SigA [Saprospiraceae bacterium]